MKLLNYISYLTLFLSLGMVLTVGYWLIYPYKIIEFKDLPIKVVNKEVVSGGHIQVRANFCKYISIGATVTRSFVDSVVYATPELVTNKEVGCADSVASIYIPKALPTGVFHIKTVYRYRVNPIRTIDIITETEEFNIIK